MEEEPASQDKETEESDAQQIARLHIQENSLLFSLQEVFLSGDFEALNRMTNELSRVRAEIYQILFKKFYASASDNDSA